MTKFLLAGHSHAYALGLPGAPTDQAPAIVPIGDDLFGLTGGWPRGEDYWDALVQASRDHIILLSFLGSEHLVHFLIEDSAPFDFICSALPDSAVREDAMLVPEAMVREMFASRHLLPSILKRIGDAGGTVWLLGTPPPKGDSEALIALLKTESIFAARLERAGYTLSDLRLTPALVQLKLWHVLQALLREAAEKAGAAFLPFPQDACTPDGYLRPDYWNRDVSHCNRQCGALFLSQIRSRKQEAA